MISFEVENEVEGLVVDLEQWMERAPLGVSRAIQPKRWRRAARESAEATLRLMADTPEEQALAAKIAASVTTAFWDSAPLGSFGMEWSAQAPAVGLAIESVTANEGRPLLEWANRGEWERLYRFVLAWVKTEKRKDAHDLAIGDERVAIGIVNILKGGTPGKDEARAGLAREIQKFIDEQSREVVGAERLEQWFIAVLEGWRELIETDVLEAVADEVLKEFKTTKRK